MRLVAAAVAAPAGSAHGVRWGSLCARYKRVPRLSPATLPVHVSCCSRCCAKWVTTRLQDELLQGAPQSGDGEEEEGLRRRRHCYTSCSLAPVPSGCRRLTGHVLGGLASHLLIAAQHQRLKGKLQRRGELVGHHLPSPLLLGRLDCKSMREVCLQPELVLQFCRCCDCCALPEAMRECLTGWAAAGCGHMPYSTLALGNTPARVAP